MNQVNSYQDHLALYEFCSTSYNECASNTSNVFSQSEINENNLECCGVCSCTQDCGRTQSCCYESGNTEYVQTHGKECIAPYVGEASFFESSGSDSIMMVIRCSDGTTGCKYKGEAVNVQPVTGHDNEVYINEDCARCNNVNEYIAWSFNVVTNLEYDVSYRALLQEVSHKTTRIYVPSEGRDLISCVTNTVHHSEGDCANATMAHLCRTLHQPFKQHLRTYKNVFCLMCKLPEESWMNGCQPSDKKSASKSLTLIIDSSVNANTISSYFGRENIATDRCEDGFIPHPTKVRSNLKMLFVLFMFLYL